jgi:hypothetical protein
MNQVLRPRLPTHTIIRKSQNMPSPTDLATTKSMQLSTAKSIQELQ